MVATRPRLLGTFSQWAALLICAALGFGVFTFVDLAPKVESEFFFSSDDPQLQSSLKVDQQFGTAEQVFIAVHAPNLISRRYLLRVLALVEDLRQIDGVGHARAVTHNSLEEPEDIPEEDPDDVFEDLVESPFWSRFLLAPDRSATFVVLRLKEENDLAAVVSAIDQTLERHARPDFELGVSGVPYVAEHIRRQLTADLQRFSLAAFAAFALIVALLFRSLSVVVGTMVASLSASFGTFIVRDLLGMQTGILMPNLWTISFVLTLSHVVYLTAQWRRQAGDVGGAQAAGAAIRVTRPASLWSLVANLLGFASLIFVSAKPVREFGIAGAIAAVLAMISAYGLYPVFLRAARPPSGAMSPLGKRLDGFFTTPHPIVAALAIAGALALAPFVPRVDTDPSLPSYFAAEGRIRPGLETIDRSSGSSPFDLVIADARDRTLDNDEAFERLMALQRRLERHPDVGSVFSIALLMAETKRPWYSFLFSWEKRFEVLESPKLHRIARTFLSADHRQARFILRMREEARSRPRAVVVGEIEDIVRKAGFEPVLEGGLYVLQGELSQLVRGSVIGGLGGLLGAFFAIALIVTRSLRTALATTLCLAITPVTLFGLLGLFGTTIDIISAPAANVALPLGIDEMIHLGYTVRRRRSDTQDSWVAWKEAIRELWGPIIASMLIVTSGFALFLLSSFPPTRRLGMLVCLGAAITDLVVLVVLPVVATVGRRRGPA